jgi:hypothetical protein
MPDRAAEPRPGDPCMGHEGIERIRACRSPDEMTSVFTKSVSSSHPMGMANAKRDSLASKRGGVRL